jgi:hypothetical protein
VSTSRPELHGNHLVSSVAVEGADGMALSIRTNGMAELDSGPQPME